MGGDSDSEESFFAEICSGGSAWKNKVFPVGQTFDQIKEWAISSAREIHRGFDVEYTGIQTYRKKFTRFVDYEDNMQEMIKNDAQVRIHLEVCFLMEYPFSQSFFSTAFICALGGPASKPNQTEPPRTKYGVLGKKFEFLNFGP